MQEYLEQMVAENPSADFEGNEPNASEIGANQMNASFNVGDTANKTHRNRMPKRSGSRSSSSAARAKKIRIGGNEVDVIFDTMESNLKNYAERETQRMKHEIGQYLQNRVDGMNNAKDVLEQTIGELNVEKDDLERDYADLEKQLRDEKKRFDAEKLASEQKIAALEEAHRQEKASFEREVAAWELKKSEINCAHCQAALQPVMFCSSECGK